MNSNPIIWFFGFILVQARSTFEPMGHLRRLFFILPFALGAIAGAFDQNLWEVIGWMTPVFGLVFLGWGNENSKWAYKKIRDFVSSIFNSVSFFVVQAINILGYSSQILQVPEYPPRVCRA